MTGLSDMEELLSRIQNKAIVDYMREGIGCYHAGAYRACIVLSYIALFDDLGQKLHQLAKTNATAKKIAKEVKQRQDDQQVFETYMVDQLKAAKLISEAEASMLEQVRVCRNKSAHPSGVHASPEEARFVFFEVIDKFLSKQLLLTTQVVDALTARLGNANFFPTNDIKETKAIVLSEMASLHDAVLPYLTEQLVSASDGADKAAAKNAQRFLVGLAYLQRDDLTAQLRKRLVKAKADNPDFGNLIVRVASANAGVLDEHDAPTILRLRALLEDVVDDVKATVAVTQLSHPVFLLGSMLDKLGEAKVLKAFGGVAHKIVANYRYTGTMVTRLGSAPALKKSWLVKLKEEAGSSTFDIANRFAANIPDIDDLLADLIKPKDAFELVVAVCDAADTGAFTSKDLRAGHFSAVPKLREMALEYAGKHPTTAGKLVQDASIVDDLDSFIEKYLTEDE